MNDRARTVAHAEVEPGSLDVHTHLAPAGVGAGAGAGPPALGERDALLAFLDDCATERALVAVPPPFFRQDLPEGESAAWVRRLNDGLLEALNGHERLLPLAYLPLEHPAVALAEFERLGAKAGPWAGLNLPGGGRSRRLDEEALAPVWTRIEAAGLPSVLHPALSIDSRLDHHYLANLLGNPIETGVAVSELLFGGVLERHPGLRIALVHCGGVLPAVLGRWQRGVDCARPGVVTDGAGPRELARRLYVDTIAHDPHLISLVLALLGEDRLLFGSDWPFPMGSRPREEVAHLSAETQRRIATANAAHFLGREHR